MGGGGRRAGSTHPRPAAQHTGTLPPMGFPAGAEPGLIPRFQGSFRVQTGRRTSEGSQLSRGCDRARRGGQPQPWGRWGGGPRGSPGEGGAAPSCSASLLPQQLQTPAPSWSLGVTLRHRQGLKGGLRNPPGGLLHHLLCPTSSSRHSSLASLWAPDPATPVTAAPSLRQGCCKEPCPGLLSTSGDLDTKLPRYLSQAPRPPPGTFPGKGGPFGERARGHPRIPRGFLPRFREHPAHGEPTGPSGSPGI